MKLKFLLKMEHNIKGQDGEVQFLIDNNLIKKNGLYLDIGSAHAYENSNTAYLDMQGWQGICLEPNPVFADSYIDRKCILLKLIANTYTGTCTFDFHALPELGKISIEGTVWKCIDIKAFNNFHFDLISIDVEGMEYDLMKNISNFPELLIFEYCTLGKHDMRLKDLCDSKGFKMLHQTKYNFIYKCK